MEENVNAGDESGNESVDERAKSPSPEARIRNYLEKGMTSFTTEVKEVLSSMGDHVQSTMKDFETKLRLLNERMHTMEDKNQNFSEVQESNAQENVIIQSPYTSRNRLDKGDNSRMKLKPQLFDGTSDIDEYLTQFNIIADLNQWSYGTKSLFLASRLSGIARSLLSEIKSDQRKDYDALVKVLTGRFGTMNRAEVYRTQLKSRLRQKGETIPEMAQSIKKLARQAYPDANADMIEILSVDSFVDALLDQDTRIRLRECGPKLLIEAETIAVKMEAHKIADKQRIKSVCPTTEIEEVSSVGQFENVMKKLENLSGKVDRLQNERPGRQYEKNFRQNRNDYVRNGNSGYNQNRMQNSDNRAPGYQNSYQRSGNSYKGQMRQNSGNSSYTGRNNNQVQGNGERSSLRAEARPWKQTGPRQ